MRLLKPDWVTHGDDKPIFSIDIHPDGSRFATGGQGDNSGKVVVWNMGPVREEKYEKDDGCPKLLCQMENHLSCVNCVRWSNSGKYLASGGDDKIIIIWQSSRSVGASSVFGSAGKVMNFEQWRVVNTLRGHSGDVLDLAWSPHDAWFASCSVDNTVVVWNALKFPEQISVLRGHSGLVKGITWDPVGKYLASQSDDKTVRVWRTLDWQEEKCVSEPFQECGGTTHVLRLNWSPDGQYIVSAHAMNNAGPTAQIIERDGWKTNMDFVGHRKAVTAVRFNPQILCKKLKKNQTRYSCCAIGSRDRSLSIWLTALKRPLVVTHDLFQSSVLDISWSTQELELMCCSWDGTVAYIGFDEEEIGKPLTTEEKHRIHKNVYGKSLAASGVNGNVGNQIVETAAMLDIQQKKDESRQSEVEMRSPQQSQPAVNGRGPKATPNKQIETRTTDGKRRITPIFLAPQFDVGEGPPQPFNPTFSTSTEKSKIDVEKSNIVSYTPTKSRDKFSLSKGSESKSDKVSPLSDKPASSEVKVHIPGVGSDQTPPNDKEKDKANKLSIKRRLDATPGSDAPPKKKDGRGRPRKYPLPTPTTPVAAPQPQVIREPAKIVYTNSGLSLPVPSIAARYNVQISGAVAGSDAALHLEIVPAASGKLHTVKCLKAAAVQWEAVMAAKPIAMAGNSTVSCIACEDQSLLILTSASGRRLFPTLVLDSKISSLKCSGLFLMAVTSKGSIFVWNVQTLSAVIKNESLVSIIPNSDIKMESALLTEQGLPVITLSNGKTYTYKADLGTWVIISTQSDPLQLGSDHSAVRHTDHVQGPLSSLQTRKHKPGSQAAHLYRSAPGGQQATTVSHLENQVACCQALQSGKEYRHWLFTYVRYLVQEGIESKLRDICEEFLGPIFKSKTNTWLPQVLGYSKRTLLREILPIIGRNLSLQRLFTEYQEQLENVT